MQFIDYYIIVNMFIEKSVLRTVDKTALKGVTQHKPTQETKK